MQCGSALILERTIVATSSFSMEASFATPSTSHTQLKFGQGTTLESLSATTSRPRYGTLSSSRPPFRRNSQVPSYTLGSDGSWAVISEAEAVMRRSRGDLFRPLHLHLPGIRTVRGRSPTRPGIPRLLPPSVWSGHRLSQQSDRRPRS